MGDLSLQDEKVFLSQIKNILPPYLKVAQYSVTPNSDDLDQNESKKKLRNAILDAFNSVSTSILCITPNDDQQTLSY